MISSWNPPGKYVNPTGLYQIFTFKQQRRSFWFNHILPPPPLPPQGHTIFPILRFCIQCFLSALHKFFVITLTAAVEPNFILPNGGLRPIWHATLSVLLSSTQRLHQVPLESFVKVFCEGWDSKRRRTEYAGAPPKPLP